MTQSPSRWAMRQNSGASRPIECAVGGGLNLVPEKIGANGVQAYRPGRLQAMPPIFARHAGGMDSPQRI